MTISFSNYSNSHIILGNQPGIPSKHSKPILRTIRTTYIDDYKKDKIDKAKNSVKNRSDFKDFVEWRIRTCHLVEKMAGLANVIKKNWAEQECQLPVTVMRYSIKGSTYQDYLLRSIDNKLKGYISLSKKNCKESPHIYIHRLITFDPDMKGAGQKLLQLAVETSFLEGCNGKVKFKAESFTQNDPSPVGFYYKQGFRAKCNDTNEKIADDLKRSKTTDINGIEMHLPDDEINRCIENIKKSPILMDSKEFSNIFKPIKSKVKDNFTVPEFKIYT